MAERPDGPLKIVDMFDFQNTDWRPYRHRVTEFEAAAYQATEDIELHGSRGVEYLKKGDYVVCSLMMTIGMEKEKFEKTYAVAEDLMEELSRNGRRWSAEATTCAECGWAFKPHEGGRLEFGGRAYAFCGGCAAGVVRGKLPVERAGGHK